MLCIIAFGINVQECLVITGNDCQCLKISVNNHRYLRMPTDACLCLGMTKNA